MYYATKSDMTEKPDKKPAKMLYLLLLVPVCMFGLLGGLLELTGKHPNFLSGFLGGLGVGVVLCIGMLIWMFGWEWIKKEAAKGKLFPYFIVGFAVAAAVSGLLAVNLGQPSCDESGDAPYSNCVSYADNGFEATAAQKWNNFWGTLPVTVIIALLIAYIVRNGIHKD